MIRPIKKNCPAGVAAPTGRVKNPASSRTGHCCTTV
nr:MAG TPA: hypothetical protein [Caudoviricetes sp.]